MVAGILLVLLLAISFAVFSLRKNKKAITDITLCDVDSSRLCIVAFGADNIDNMVINFQVPEENYPLFYAKVSNKGVTNTYPCDVVTAVPTSVVCSGTRTPLGESVDVEVYTSEEDALIARGSFLVSAFMRVTPVIEVGTPVPTNVSTPLPGTAYPNP
jgi:hypothetical protein